MRSNHLGGVNALDWRKNVAAFSKGSDGDYVRTFKFPLEIKEDLSRILPDAEKLYDTLEGTEKGGLPALVFAVHLSGFRLFGSVAETRAFEEKKQFNDQKFLKIANEHFNEVPGKLRPSKIFISLKKTPRMENAKWDVDHILKKFHGDLGINNNADERLLGVFDSLAKTIHAKYANWKEISDSPLEALKIFSCAFQKIDSGFPDFSTVKIRAIEPKGRRLSYDPEMAFHKMEAPDYWIHHCISVISRSLVNEGMASETPGSKEIQVRFTTQSHNGLDWLFNSGLAWFRETSVPEICKKLGIPDNEKQRVEQLQSFAKEVVYPNSLWKELKFGAFRKKVGGKLDSWISNYWGRLDDLQNYFNNPPAITIPPQSEEKYNNLFSGNNLSVDALRHAVADILPQEMNKAGKAVRSLRGEAEYQGTNIEIVQDATAYLGSLLGEIEILNNRVEQKKENENAQPEKQRWEQLKIDLKTIKKPDQLNRIGGGTIRVKDALEKIKVSLNLLLETRREHYKALLNYAADGGNLNPLPSLIEREKKKLEDRGRGQTAAEENARRWILHQLAILANRMSKETRDELIRIVSCAFPEKDSKGRKNRSANRFFHNRQGAIYVSPFSTRRHEPLLLAEIGFTKDWLAEAESLLNSVREKLLALGTPGLHKDMLILEGYIFAMKLRSLPLSLPAKLGEHALVMHKEEKIFIPPVLRAQFVQQKEVSRDAVLRLFNLYANAINGLLFQATRTGFITRAVFSRGNTDKLVYAPKQDKDWAPPKPYFKGSSPIASALKKDWIVWKDKNRSVVDVGKTFAKLCKVKKEINTKEAAAYLAQSPHDWWLALNIEGIGEERCGMTVSTSGSGKFLNAGKNIRGLVRLQGPSSWRTMLDRTLRMKSQSNDLKFGDPNLIMDTRYSQKVELKNDSLHIKAERETTKIEAAIPLIDKAARNEKSKFNMFNRIVAIDQGERGIGYAVFDLKEYLEAERAKPMTDAHGRPVTGFVSVPSIRALIRTVRSHRRRSQPQQKINMTYSTLLRQRRENVVGDVCNRIDTLCKKYDGFPVLESTVGNFESGGKQLELVYNSVSKMYLYDVNSMERNTERQHRWVRAKEWQHPWLVKRKYDKNKDCWLDQPGGLYTLYPGASVAPAGTSQTCHQCGRNPIREIKVLEDSHLDVCEGGYIKFPGGQIKLCDGSEPPAGEEKEKWRNRMSREKKRLPKNRPKGAGRYKKDEIDRLLKRNLRRPNPSTQSPDTTQSRYHCVYTDCNFTGHADVNAAVNIGVKFLKDRVHKEGSKKNI